MTCNVSDRVESWRRSLLSFLSLIVLFPSLIILLYCNMISRIVASIAVLLAVVVSAASAFSTQQHSSIIGKTRQSQLQPTTICFAEGDDSNDATNNEPKVAVKCPDCDLCDGSGRCVSYQYENVHIMCTKFANYREFSHVQLSNLCWKYH